MDFPHVDARACAWRRRRRLVRTGLAVSLVAVLALAGCSGKDSNKKPGAQSTSKGLTLAGEWPLTGLTSSGKTPKHPVMVVKIDNTDSSSPQVGLSKADLVTEELVEGGVTRLAVFFYQHVPKLVGPVRSMRATDIGIVKPAKAVIVASGGAPPTVRRIRNAGIRAYTEGATGFQRDNSRSAPYNLFNHLNELAATLQARVTVPSYLPFGSADEKVSGKAASGVDAQFSGSHTTSWTYQNGAYVNKNSHAAAGDHFHPDTVLVLRVKVGDAGYLDPAGNHVPETHFTGTGKALMFHGGHVVHGTWKKTLDSTIKLRTTSGGQLRVPAGHTWIELVPKNGGRVFIKK